MRSRTAISRCAALVFAGAAGVPARRPSATTGRRAARGPVGPELAAEAERAGQVPRVAAVQPEGAPARARQCQVARRARAATTVATRARVTTGNGRARTALVHPRTADHRMLQRAHARRTRIASFERIAVVAECVWRNRTQSRHSFRAGLRASPFPLAACASITSAAPAMFWSEGRASRPTTFAAGASSAASNAAGHTSQTRKNCSSSVCTQPTFVGTQPSCPPPLP